MCAAGTGAHPIPPQRRVGAPDYLPEQWRRGTPVCQPQILSHHYLRSPFEDGPAAQCAVNNGTHLHFPVALCMRIKVTPHHNAARLSCGPSSLTYGRSRGPLKALHVRCWDWSPWVPPAAPSVRP